MLTTIHIDFVKEFTAPQSFGLRLPLWLRVYLEPSRWILMMDWVGIPSRIPRCLKLGRGNGPPEGTPYFHIYPTFPARRRPECMTHLGDPSIRMEG